MSPICIFVSELEYCKNCRNILIDNNYRVALLT